MNAKEWAAKLNGRECGFEANANEEKRLEQDGIVIAYGFSDDLCELRGVVDEEYDCFGGSEISVESIKIRIVWHDKGNPCWTFETDIPHETFDIYEDGELYCKGIVFNLADCKKPRTNFEKIKAMDVNEMTELLAAIAEHCNARATECSNDCPLWDTEDCTACGISRWLESKCE